MALDTSKEKGTFTFIWKLENFSHCLRTRGTMLKSPMFFVDSLNKSHWSIWIYLKCYVEDDQYFSFCLGCEDLESSNIVIDFQLSLVAADGSVANKDKALGMIFNSDEGQSVPGTKYNQKDVFETKRSIYLPQDTLTVFCRLWETDGGIGEHFQCFACTRLGVQRRMSVLWRIEHFSEIGMGEQRNTTVSLAAMVHAPMVLNVSLERQVHESHLKIQISREKFPDGILLSCTISVLNRYKIAVKEMQDSRMCFSDQDLSWTFPQFISRRELMEWKDHLLPQDALSLKFEFTFSVEMEHESIHYGPPTRLNEDSIENWWNATELSPDRPPTDSATEGYLQSDLLSLHQEQTLSDFELRSEGVAFPVHKAILCARSPVFKAMFTSEMHEVTTNYLSVPDVDADTLTRMLLYVYTDTVEDLELETASKLYYASDKYQILSLKQKCSSVLKSNLTVDNLSVVLSLADRHHDDELTSAVQDFILRHAEEIVRSTAWMEFDQSNSHLAAITIYAVFRKKLQIKP